MIDIALFGLGLGLRLMGGLSDCHDTRRLDATTVTVCRDPRTGEGRVAMVSDDLGNVNVRRWWITSHLSL